MHPIEKSTLPRPFLVGLFLCAGFALFTAWDQSHWWQNKEDYSFGWLVPAFVAYIIYIRWPSISAVARGHRGENIRNHLRPDTLLIPFARAATLVVIALATPLFLLGAFYRSAAGPSYSGTLAITLGMVGLTLAIVYFTAPVEAGPSKVAELNRQKLTRLFLFPIFVWLISAPMITAVESNLNLFLMHQITSVVFWIFDLLGLPLEQRGNILVLPSGTVGVAEACSGIRSLTGCLFAGSFLAAVFLENRWMKCGLIAAALVLAVTTNLLRSVFLTSWAYAHGAKAIEGSVHDISGYAILVVTVIGLLVIISLLSRRSQLR